METTGIVRIQRASNVETAEPEQRLFYSVSEVARMFGTCNMTLYRAISDGQFPAIRVRGRLVIPVEAISAMVAEATEKRVVVDAADWVSSGRP